jgi:hypothetical protein
MNRSHHDIVKRSAACCVALLLSGGAAYASNGEHTDWPDYPDGDLMTIKFQPLPSEIFRVERERKRREVLSLDPEEHTDWPDYPDGDPSSFLNRIEIPNDPNAMPIGPIPSIDDLISPFGSSSGLDGIGSSTPVDLGLNSLAPVPAPGGALLMLGLAAAATRRRR